jgi:hypothetical protein
VAPLLAGAIVLAAGSAWAGSHVNEKVGYRLKLPEDFEHVPEEEPSGEPGEFFIPSDPNRIDSFKCTKTLSTNEGWQFRRFVMTYYFPEITAADIAKRREEEQKKAGEEGATFTIDGLGGDRIYLTFKEYAEANIRGFFFSAEKPAKVAGHDATLYEMTFEKLSNLPQRWMACSYKVPGGEFAIVATCTEQHFKKCKPDMTSLFNGFKMLDAEGLRAKDHGSVTFKAPTGDDVDEDELSPEEILARRKQQREEAFEKCRAGLEKGWRHMETDNFLVVYECDPKYAKDVGRQAEGVRAWLEETFPGIGEGFVQAAIIRVYESEDRIPASRGGWSFSFNSKGHVQEIRFGRSADRSGFVSEFDSLNEDVMAAWFRQKNSELWNRMPEWLTMGLYEYIEDADLKGAKLVFSPDEWEKDQMTEALRLSEDFKGDAAGAPLKPLRTLLAMSEGDLYAQWSYSRVQCASVIRYFIEGPGRNNAKTRTLLGDYIKNLYAQVEEVEKRIEEQEKAEREGKKKKEGLSEEEALAAEDEEYKKKRENAYGAVAKELLDKAFQTTFADWSDQDWAALENSWRNHVE